MNAHRRMLRAEPFTLPLDGHDYHFLRLKLPDGSTHETDYMTAHIIADQLGMELYVPAVEPKPEDVQ